MAHSLRSDRDLRTYYDRAVCRLIVGDPVPAISLLSNCNYVHGKGPQ